MKVLVAFTICPDLDLLNTMDLAVINNTQVDLQFLPYILNCFDESALELALRLQEKFMHEDFSEEKLELSAITVGGKLRDLSLQTLKALGYAHTVRIDADENSLRFRPHVIANSIASYAQKHHQSLLLLGQEAPLGNGACIPQLVATYLGFPMIPCVTNIISTSNNTVTVELMENHCIIEATIALPCVLAIGNAVVSKLRVPTLRQRLKWKKAEDYIEPAMLSCLDACEPTLQCLKVPPFHGRRAYMSEFSGSKAVENIFTTFIDKRLKS